MSLTWAGLDGPLRTIDSPRLTALLLAVGEPERLAFAGEVEARVRSGSRAGSSFDPAGCLALTVIACMPTAARAAALLTRRDMREWRLISTDCFLQIARARRLPWLGDLGVRLAQHLPARDPWGADWLFAESLLIAGDTEPPVTEGAVRAWLLAAEESCWFGRSASLAEAYRGSPWLDLLLPAVFELDGVGSDLPDLFPAAVTSLVTEGRLDRKTVLSATLDRLTRPDRPARLRPFARLHAALEPVPVELAQHVPAYLAMLPDAPSPVAGLAQRALRALDEAGLLDVDTVLEAGRSLVARPEKVLVRAQLAWFRQLARRAPQRAADIREVVALALAHPAADLRERAAALIGVDASVIAYGGHPAAGSDAAGLARGDHPALAADLEAAGSEAAGLGFGGQPAGPGLPAVVPVAAVPPPIADAAELAAEVVALLHEASALRWERVMAALVTLPEAGLAETLGPVLDRYRGSFTDRWGRIPFLGEAIGARIGRERGHVMRERLLGIVRRSWTDAGGGMDRSLINTPSGVLTLRIAELAAQVTRSPVPVLLATPTHVTGSLDGRTLVQRLERHEAAGGEPWPLDFQQALLRVPRTVDAEVLARAEALTSPAGRQLAGWFRSGGLPDPVSTRFVQSTRDPDGRVVVRRVVANLETGRGDDDRILLEDALCTINRRPRPEYRDQPAVEADVLAMVLPHHREAVAAWALPELAALADQDARGASLLPLLADCSGPIGPAMTLALAYGLGARRPANRVAAVDALLALAAGPDPFAAAVGSDLGDLCADGTVKLSRVVTPLTDAHQAGASVAVWEIVAAALPALLPAAPRGLPDLLELATMVATAVGARTEIPGLAAVTGRSRAAREARRLRATLAAG